MEGNPTNSTPPSLGALVTHPSATDPAPSEGNGGGSGDFTPAQLAQMAQWEVEAGRMTPEQANAALAVDSQPPLAAIPQDDSLDPEALTLRQHFPAAKPSEYDLPYEQHSTVDEQTQRDVDLRMREWLSTARFPRGHGSSLAHIASDVGKRYQSMGTKERTLWAQSEKITLERLWGDQANEKIALAQQLVDELEAKSPGVKVYLEASGAGNSAMFIAQVAAQAERLLGMQSKKKV